MSKSTTMTIDEAIRIFAVQLDADGRSPHTQGQYRRHLLLLSRWARDYIYGIVVSLTRSPALGAMGVMIVIGVLRSWSTLLRS